MGQVMSCVHAEAASDVEERQWLYARWLTPRIVASLNSVHLLSSDSARTVQEQCVNDTVKVELRRTLTVFKSTQQCPIDTLYNCRHQR